MLLSTTEPRIGSLCTGFGALDAAVNHYIKGRVVWHADIKPASEYLLDYRFPEVPNHGDLREIDWSLVEPVEVLAGSWPCQPHSAAGRQLGADDPRDLWPEFLRAIKALKPGMFFGENVARIVKNGELDRVTNDLTSIGYRVAWTTSRASWVGAPHRRERCFVVASFPDA